MNQTLTAFFSHAQTSHGVTVRVAVTFLPEQSEPDRARWFWAYHIRIENGRPAPVQLLTRNWTISDGRGALHHVEGEGVVGEQPVIQPGGAYDYVSGCPLNTPTGWMTGSYRMLDSDGGTLEIPIPQFNLLAPAVSD